MASPVRFCLWSVAQQGLLVAEAHNAERGPRARASMRPSTGNW